MRTRSKILLVAAAAALSSSIALAQASLQTIAGLKSSDNFYYGFMTVDDGKVKIRVRCQARSDPARGEYAHCEGKLEK